MDSKSYIEGKIEEKEKVVRKCLEENMQPKVIAKLVKLSISEVIERIAEIKKRKEDEK